MHIENYWEGGKEITLCNLYKHLSILIGGDSTISSAMVLLFTFI